MAYITTISDFRVTLTELTEFGWGEALALFMDGKVANRDH